ncbi:hypothetical protein [Streptomyces sp. NPDC046685]|uniref:hypothetical protein n=1 Tax=Streptomyces sp. NPDC046685 TaxID=3157202 RepID=UPI0033C07367
MQDGHNYEKEVAIAGGTLDRAYVERKNRNKYSCRKDPGCKSSSSKNYLSSTLKKPEKKTLWDSLRGGANATWGWTKETFGTWEGWKNRVLPAAGSAACVVASAGVCGIAGATIAVGVYVGDGVLRGEWNETGLVTNLAWGAIGTGAAYKYARWGGASRGGALWGSALSRSSVVTKPATTTSGAIRRPGPMNWSVTRGNMVGNANFALGFCGAGSVSPGKLVGSC